VLAAGGRANCHSRTVPSDAVPSAAPRAGAAAPRLGPKSRRTTIPFDGVVPIYRLSYGTLVELAHAKRESVAIDEEPNRLGLEPVATNGAGLRARRS
jgi:hypothetical protein